MNTNERSLRLYGRPVYRTEIVGREGGPYPIHVEFHDEDGDLVGSYARESSSVPAITSGPLFETP